MTELRQTTTSNFDSLTHPELVARYETLRQEALAKGDGVETSVLHEMVQLCQTLRRRSSGPPKVAKAKALPTLEDL